MRKKSLTHLGETEMEVLHLVWDLQNATVADVHERLLERREVAYTTVLTVLRNLARKGYLTYEKDGVAHVYSPARPAEEVQHSLLQSLISKVFKDSPRALVQTLVKYEALSEADRAELRTLIDRLPDASDAEPDEEATS